MSKAMEGDFNKGRRDLLIGGAALTGSAILGAPHVARAQGGRQALKVSVGWIPWAAANSPVSKYMINNKLFEKRAAEQGYDVTVDWREYPTALPMVEAVVGNNLDIGMWGNTPIVRAISTGLPISLGVVGEGHLRFLPDDIVLFPGIATQVIQFRLGSPDVFP